MIGEQLKLFANDLFSCTCEEPKVQYCQQFKGKAPPVARTTDEADNPNVIAHAQGQSTRIVAQPRSRKQGCAMETREARGLQIALSSHITRLENLWIVPSQTSAKKYAVDLDNNPPTCTCPDYEAHRRECKHILAVRYQLRRDAGESLSEPERITRPTYRQEWHEYNQAQRNEKSRFQELLYQLCQTIDEPPQLMGRPRALLADVIFCAGVKVYETVSGRRNMSDLREAQQRGYVTSAVHYNTTSKYLERAGLTPYLKELITESALPLKGIETEFSADSSGFRIRGTSTWFNHKYGREIEKSEWLKVHIMTGRRTNIVTAVEVSDRKANDTLFFPPLLDKTAEAGFNLREVSADKGYDSFKNRRLALLKGAIPYIPFRSDANPEGKGALWLRMYHFFRYHSEEFASYYHKRSNVESTFSMMKRKFGESLRSRTADAQINEALLKVLCHNICCLVGAMYELGVEPDFMVKEPL
jgi:transposase